MVGVARVDGYIPEDSDSLRGWLVPDSAEDKLAVADLRFSLTSLLSQVFSRNSTHRIFRKTVLSKASCYNGRSALRASFFFRST